MIWNVAEKSNPGMPEEVQAEEVEAVETEACLLCLTEVASAVAAAAEEEEEEEEEEEAVISVAAVVDVSLLFAPS